MSKALKLYQADNLNGAAITVFAESKAAVRALIKDEDSVLWSELRKTDFARHSWGSRVRVDEVKPGVGVVCGVVSY